MSCSLKYEVIHVIIENSSKLKIKDIVFKMKGPSLLKMTSALKQTETETGACTEPVKGCPEGTVWDSAQCECVKAVEEGEQESYWPGGSPRSKEAKFERTMRLLVKLGYTEEEARAKILEDNPDWVVDE